MYTHFILWHQEKTSLDLLGFFCSLNLSLTQIFLFRKVEGFGLVCFDVYDLQFDHRALCFWIYTSAFQVSAKVCGISHPSHHPKASSQAASRKWFACLRV